MCNLYHQIYFIMSSLYILQRDLSILTQLYISSHNMAEHPVGADLYQLAEISQLMTKISLISGKPLPPFVINKHPPKTIFTKVTFILQRSISNVKQNSIKLK
jgi:hypothetical protein